jgi:alkylation response protein AidB-like acyl-CoA dehydrogenase
MAGYSGTPLPKKLGIKEQARIALLDIPSDVRAELKAAIAGCELASEGRTRLDFVLLFVKTQAELRKTFPHWAKRLEPAGMLWVAWPKKSSGVVSDLDENKVRQAGLSAGLVDVKVCAVSEVWSGLKFVIPVKDRTRVR